MFNLKKYFPSVKGNNQLRDKVVSEINSYIYRLEKGRYTSESDQEAIISIINDLKVDAEILSHTVGTGKENVESLANKILDLLTDLKKTSEQDTLHRIQESVDDIDFHVNLWKDVLDGVDVKPDEIDTKVAKVSYSRKRLNASLEELAEIKDNFAASARRLERDIVGFEKDREEYDAQIINEDNERIINELFKKISAIKSKVDSLTVRKANYNTCYNLLDMIYVNAAEIVEASDFASEEIGKAKALLNVQKLKKVLTEPDKAVIVLKRMQADIKEIYERTQTIDSKLAEMSTTSTVVSDDALAYKAELMRKKREREAHSEEIITDNINTNNVDTTTVEEE